MKNFYESEGLILSGAQFIENWKQELMTVESKSPLQTLSSHTLALWQAFNAERSKLAKGYMSDKKLFTGYLASFFLPNIERTYALLKRHSEIKKHITSDTLTIIDFGAGPLSATIGFLFALNDWKITPKKVKVYAIERSHNAVTWASKFLAMQSSIEIEVVSLASFENVNEDADIILAANVFNEILPRYHFETAERLIPKLRKGGLFLLLEPGQEVHSKNMGVLRDDIVRKYTSLSIIGPCFHKRQCPLSAKSDRKDWCWFHHKWDVPTLLQDVDRITRLKHEDLNYSYVLFVKSKEDAQGFARVVSEPITIPFPRISSTFAYASKNLTFGSVRSLKEVFDKNTVIKTMLCTKDGILESQFDNNDPKITRGDVAKTKPLLRVKERFQLEEKKDKTKVKPKPRG